MCSLSLVLAATFCFLAAGAGGLKGRAAVIGGLRGRTGDFGLGFCKTCSFAFFTRDFSFISWDLGRPGYFPFLTGESDVRTGDLAFFKGDRDFRWGGIFLTGGSATGDLDIVVAPPVLGFGGPNPRSRSESLYA